MGERKNIDRLFQEQLKNFEETPRDDVWENIRKELEKTHESKKKVLPIWYRLGGIAASFMLLLGLAINLWSDETTNINPVIVNTSDNSKDEKSINTINSNKKDTHLKNQKNIQEVVVFENGNEENVINTSTNDHFITDVNTQKTTTEAEDNNYDLHNKKVNSASYVNNNNFSHEVNQVHEANKKKLTVTAENLSDKVVIVNGVQGNKEEVDKKSDKNTYNIVVSNSAANNQFKGTENFALNTDGNEYSIKGEQLNKSNVNNSLAENKFNLDTQKDNSVIDSKNSALLNASLVSAGKDTFVAANKTNDHEADKNVNEKSLEKRVADNSSHSIDTEKLEKLFSDNDFEESEIVENDTNEKKLTEEEDEKKKEFKEAKPQTIEEAIAEQETKEDAKEEESKENGLQKKWQVRPNIAPVYYNSLSSGSPIDEQFKGNKKKGELNMSYGVNVSYNLNKKLKVRAGLNKVELGYNTENVAVVPAEGVGVDFIRNVDMSSQASQLNIASADGFSVSQIPSSFQKLFDSRISQKFGYLEVPLELSYQVSDKKLSIDLIAGMSTFFLNKNEVHASTNAFTTYLGEANNLNKTSFSTNFGVGFNYKISKAFHLNVEPTFKYQLNSFSNDAGNFKPYILGVYSGLSFRF